MADTLTPSQCAAKLGISVRTLSRHRAEYRHLELSKRIGHKVYSLPLVDQWLSGQRVVNFGAGRLVNRRAS